MQDLHPLFALPDSPKRDQVVQWIRSSRDPSKRKNFLLAVHEYGFIPDHEIELLLQALMLETA
ncbi:hypothetical protein [Altererythrobacter sp. Root672]|uniref:hypothetical protein n=1 Tax=Altererythrobacter sp. Root672 TaxID=1736584 RepID=UPI0006FB3D84|nr:hypothetical protein [Altererythrobacter sp. Root672]KRA84225.1 hypothetical protein ASD76_09635 [Altererythrobacter sp. Root672]